MPAQPPSPEQDLRTAEELVYLLEHEDPKAIAANAQAVTGLVRAIGELDELLSGHQEALERARRLRERLAWILAGVQKARPDKWAPRPGPGGPQDPTSAKERPQGSTRRG